MGRVHRAPYVWSKLRGWSAEIKGDKTVQKDIGRSRERGGQKKKRKGCRVIQKADHGAGRGRAGELNQRLKLA